MLNFIAEIKEKLKKQNVDASYLCVTNNLRDGIRVGDSLVFFEHAKGNQYVARIFAPKDVKIYRVDSDGEPLKLPTH